MSEHDIGGHRYKRRRFLKYGATASLAGVAGCLGGGTDGGSGQDNGGATTTTAGGEQKVVVYGPVPDPQAKPFKEKTGIPVNTVTGPGAQTIARFLNEESSGQHVMDIITNKAGEFTNDDLLSELAPTPDINNYPDIVPDKILEEGEKKLGSDAMEKTLIDAVNVRMFIYNTENVDEPPTTFEDVLDERFQDDIITPSFNIDSVLATLQRKWGKDRAEQYMLDFDELNPAYSSSGMIKMVEKISAGQYKLGFMMFGFVASAFMGKGAPIGVSFPRFTSMFVGGDGLSADAPHRDAAIQYQNFRFTEEGQKIFQKHLGGRMPLHKDMKHGNPAIREKMADVEVEPLMFDAEQNKYYKNRIEELIGVGGG